VSRPLRIFLSCQQALRRHAVPAYSFWADYFRGGLAEAGHTCVEAPACDWAEGLLPLDDASATAWRERTWDAALDCLRREHARQPVDFFLGYLFPRQVLPSAVAEIRALGIPCVNFFCDNVREFRRVPEAYRGFDLHWVPEFKAGALYRRAGLPWIDAPMACWVPPAWRTPVETDTRPIAFIGTRDEQREVLFADVLRRGLPLDLRGPGWDVRDIVTPTPVPSTARNPIELVRRQLRFAEQHGWPALLRKCACTLHPRAPVAFDFTPFARPPLFGDAYWPALRECRVCIGVNRYPSLRFPFHRPDTYSRLRDIEAPMAGACYLTEWTEGLDRLYDLGAEIETYRDATELVEKARALAEDGPRRARLRAAGQRRALSDHSISRTINRIAERLNCA
jgi:hypothetical protein